LSVQRERPEFPFPESEPIWLPALPPPPDVPPLPPRPSSASMEPGLLSPIPVPAPDFSVPTVAPDWYGTAREVAKEMRGKPGQRTFGESPDSEAERARDEAPPSIWPKPLPRVGTTVTTPEGETIIWVSDRCFVTLGTTSLTMGDLHRARQGVRRCIVAEFGGKKKARGDLFDSIKRLPKRLPEPKQDPGCGAGAEPESCAP
jgi:hypothetical protein